MSERTFLLATLLGGVVGMDVVTFPQMMISRPLVAATLGGALGGHAVAGLLAGAALEMLAMELLPVGAARYPEWGSASVAGGVVAAGRGPASSVAGALVLGLLVALAAAWAGGWSMHALRRLNGTWSVRAQRQLDAGDAAVVAALQRRGLALDFVRAAALTAIAMGAAWCVPNVVLARWSAGAWLTMALAAALGAAVAGSSAWRLSAGAPRSRTLALVALVLAASIAMEFFL